MKHYEVKNSFQINYKKILDDYRKNFSNRRALIRTNYKPLEEFIVTFNTRDLPHLMGWEKIVDKRSYANNIVKLIDNEKLIYSNSRHHRNFHKIKDRMFNYEFLYEIFWEHNHDVCVMTSDMKPNPQKLDIVFFKQSSPREIIVLGLRKRYNMESFVPTTLHTESIKGNQYLLRRRTRIKSIQWI